jgi:hypothetical protein
MTDEGSAVVIALLSFISNQTPSVRIPQMQ